MIWNCRISVQSRILSVSSKERTLQQTKDEVMYITDNMTKNNAQVFNWADYFSPEKGQLINSEELAINIVNKIRGYLSEDPHKMVFVFNNLMLKLTSGLTLSNPNVLEIGAATGLLSRWFLDSFGGSATLIDNNQSSYHAFQAMMKGYDQEYSMEYHIEDLFSYVPEKSYDICCSFGLIEHFADKKNVIEAHRKHLKAHGYVVILIPIDSTLSRVYWDLHPELNLGYRELLTTSEFKDVLLDNHLKIHRIEQSSGYVYDFAGAVCTLE